MAADDLRIPPENEFPPDLQHRLEKLSDRQEEECHEQELLNDSHDYHVNFPPQDVQRYQRKEMDKLTEKHDAERERYIREYYEAQKLVKEYEQQDKQQAREPEKGRGI
jgi:hypothetical protein